MSLSGRITTKVLLVKVKSLEFWQDPLVGWLQGLGFWNRKIRSRVSEADLHLPLDIETQFQNKFNLPLQNPTRALFEILLKDMNGVCLEVLGLPGKTWMDPETCTGKLYRLGLVRVQEDEGLLKPINQVSFDPRVQYLIGVRLLPY